MAKRRKSDTGPVPLLIMSDLLTVLLAWVPVIAAYFLTVKFVIWSFADPSREWLAVASPLVLILSLISILFLFRLLLPRPRKGAYRLTVNRGTLAWACHFQLNRAILLSGLRAWIFTSNVLRFLYLRAMGARIAFRINGSSGIDFVDLPLIEIGEGSTLAEGVVISCHSFTGETLIIDPVRVGKHVFLGMDVVLGPGTEIGDRSWIGTGNKMMGANLPAGTLLKNFEWSHGEPKGGAPNVSDS